MTSEIRNELAWALDATKNPPHIKHGVDRMHVTREYARLHTLLKAVDEAIRDWKPVPRIQP